MDVQTIIKYISVKTAMGFSLFCLILGSCSNNKLESRNIDFPKNENQKQSGFKESKSFLKYLREMDDYEDAKYGTERFFSIIGEEGFYNNSDYDLYGILLGKSGHETYTIFTFKSINKITTVSRKQFVKPQNAVFMYSKKDSLDKFKLYEYICQTKILNEEDLKNLTVAFDKAAAHLSEVPLPYEHKSYFGY